MRIYSSTSSHRAQLPVYAKRTFSLQMSNIGMLKCSKQIVESTATTGNRSDELFASGTSPFTFSVVLEGSEFTSQIFLIFLSSQFLSIVYTNSESWCHTLHNFRIDKQQLFYEVACYVILDERLLQPANLKDRIKKVLEVPLLIIRTLSKKKKKSDHKNQDLRSTCLRI